MKQRLRKKVERHPVDAKGRTVFVAQVWRKGRIRLRRQVCRMDACPWDDPITAMSGCDDEFAADFQRRDRAEGCPACIERSMP